MNPEPPAKGPKTFVHDSSWIHFTVYIPPSVSPSYMFLEGRVVVRPHERISNVPLQIDLKGYLISTELSTTPPVPLDLTEDTLAGFTYYYNSREFMMTSAISQQHSYRREANRSAVEDLSRSPEYFLYGSETLYQVLYDVSFDGKSKVESIPLETFQLSSANYGYLYSNTSYEYPIKFLLPINLPESIEHVVLNSFDITVKYLVAVSMQLPIHNQTQIVSMEVPFVVCELPKEYPYEVLTNSQRIRCYHYFGDKRDSHCSVFGCLCRYICPCDIMQSYFQERTLYQSRYSRYDNANCELIVVVHKNKTFFLMCRVYLDPSSADLTVNRSKNEDSNANNKQQLDRYMKSGKCAYSEKISSLTSVHITSRKRRNNLEGKQATITMYGYLRNYIRKAIFTKTVNLTDENYDMMQGECLVDLTQYGADWHSYHNELFALYYTFEINVKFTTNNTEETVYCFVVRENVNHLPL